MNNIKKLTISDFLSTEHLDMNKPLNEEMARIILNYQKYCKAFQPSLDEIQEIEDLLEEDGMSEFDNDPRDSYFNGVRAGIQAYCEKYRDNPVPSLDKKINNIVKAHLKGFEELFDPELLIEDLIKLQNGVETNKEQPECNWEQGKACFKPCTCFDD